MGSLLVDSHRAALPYPEMTVEAICAINVAGLAHDDRILWLWTTNAHHCDAYACSMRGGLSTIRR